MSENSFKDYIENRTIADIMEDYGEQRGEWETLLVTDEHGVKRFRHKNGRDFFCEQYDPGDAEYEVSENVLKILSGKTIEEQMEFYYVTQSSKFYSTAYGSVTKEDLRKYSVKLSDYKEIRALLLKGNILIGAKIDCWPDFAEGILLPDRRVCTYYASDNEGSGTNDREDYAYLIFADSIGGEHNETV
ncbi:MAG: hypothetical protein LUH82_05665 [Clostridiales bacterium]|nr:hypothetical protein [Clostridiales bacterium]